MKNIMCMRCKRKTMTANPRQVGNRLTGTCGVCGTNKSQFIKKGKSGPALRVGSGKRKGKGILDILSSLF